MVHDSRIPPKGMPRAEHREPLWDRVDANRIRLALYVVVFVIVAVVVMDAFVMTFGGCLLLFVLARSNEHEAIEWMFANGNVGAIFELSALFGLVSLLWALFAIRRSEKWLLRQVGATIIPKGEHLDTKMALKDMAIAAGMPVAPALYMIDNTTVNAFAFSAHRRRPVIGITKGMTTKLSVDEQRAVFANLVARLVSGDTIESTGISALLWPMHAWRERTIAGQNRMMDREMIGERVEPNNDSAAVFFVFGVAMAVIGQLFAWAGRHKQLRSAERADAEGMLLLKDPRAMLTALERSVELDNVVPGAGEMLGNLFYCWPADSTNDEDDPEWHRVARLREVLGVEGWVGPQEPERPAVPLPPRLD